MILLLLLWLCDNFKGSISPGFITKNLHDSSGTGTKRSNYRNYSQPSFH